MKNKEEVIMEFIERFDFEQLNHEEQELVNAISNEVEYKEMRRLFLELSEQKQSFESNRHHVLFMNGSKQKKKLWQEITFWKAVAIIALACNLFFIYNYVALNPKTLADKQEEKSNPTLKKAIEDSLNNSKQKMVFHEMVNSETIEKNTTAAKNKPFKIAVQATYKVKKEPASINTSSLRSDLNTLSSAEYRRLNLHLENKSMANDALIKNFTFVAIN